MSNTAESQPAFNDLSWIEKVTYWLKYHRMEVKEYFTFCAMEKETLEMYTDYKVPVPPKDLPFSDEFPDPETNPLLMEMRYSLYAAETVTTWLHRLVFALAGVLVLLFVLQGAWIGVVVTVALWATSQVAINMAATSKKSKFMENYEFVEGLARLDPTSEVTQTFWNWKRWQKWAMARYVFNSEEELYAALTGREFAIIRSGPMNGLLVSTSTKQELPLRAAA